MDSFENSYWNLAQVLTWAPTRNRDLIKRLPRLAYPIATSTEGDHGEHPDTAFAWNAVLNAARAGELHPLGVENGMGDHKEIPKPQLAGLELYHGDDGEDFAGPENNLRPGATRWHDLRFAKSEVIALWPEIEVHETQPLVPADNDTLARYANYDAWTLTQALYLLYGNRPPDSDSPRDLSSFFPLAYELAVIAIHARVIGRQSSLAGERRFIAAPEEWLSWAEGKGINIDGRVLQAVRKSPATPDLTNESRFKGGSARKFDAGLQEFVDRLFAEFETKGIRLTPLVLNSWLMENAQKDEGYDPVPEIPDFDDLEFYDEKVWWKNRRGHQKSVIFRALERYTKRARDRASG